MAEQEMPEKMYLHMRCGTMAHTDPFGAYPSSIMPGCTEYVRADIHDAEIERLKAENESLNDQLKASRSAFAIGRESIMAQQKLNDQKDAEIERLERQVASLATMCADKDAENERLKDPWGVGLVPGDRIRLTQWMHLHPIGTKDYTVEMYRGCLGVFESEALRRMGRFTPLCELYGPGPDSERLYEPNHGEYCTGEVPMWMNIPRPGAEG